MMIKYDRLQIINIKAMMHVQILIQGCVFVPMSQSFFSIWVEINCGHTSVI